MARIGSLYEKALQRHEKDVRFEGPLPPGPGVRLCARKGGVELQALVDPSSHRISALRHSGGALLNALGSVCLGYTVQDASEHAAIRLEGLLREKPAMRPVPGVVQPENADPAFRLPLDLVRGLLAEYRERTGFSPSMNTEEGPVFHASSEWGTSTVPERMQKLRAAIPAVEPGTGIAGRDVQVKAVSGPRVTVGLPDSASPEARQRYLTFLELEWRARVDPKIEVFLDDKKDSNVKRHATEEALGL